MGILRILQFVIGGLFLAALALFAVLAFGTGAGEQAVAQSAERPSVSVNHLTDDLEKELLAEKPEGEGLSFVENLILTVTGRAITAVEDAQAEAVLNVAELSRDHRVELTYMVHLTELMPAGITAVPQVDRDLFALGHMANYVRARECPILLETLATACQVSRIEVDPAEDNYYRVEAEVVFAAADAPGEVPLAENLRTVSEWFDAYESRRPKGDIADHNQVRRLGYGFAVEQCAALRKTYGNCVLEQVEFRALPVRGDDTAVKATVRVKVSAVLPQSDS